MGNDFTVPMAQSTFSEVFDKKLEVMERELAYVVCLEMLQQEKSAANQYFNEKLPNVSGVVMVICDHRKMIRLSQSQLHFAALMLKQFRCFFSVVF